MLVNKNCLSFPQAFLQTFINYGIFKMLSRKSNTHNTFHFLKEAPIMYLVSGQSPSSFLEDKLPLWITPSQGSAPLGAYSECKLEGKKRRKEKAPNPGLVCHTCLLKTPDV